MPPGRLPGEVFRACPSGRRPPGRPRTRWRDYVSRLAWERLGIPPDELEEAAAPATRPRISGKRTLALRARGRQRVVMGLQDRGRWRAVRGSGIGESFGFRGIGGWS
ncbi:hypothetical protein D4764_14G0004540 [Takifugu flavidus]|uniref:Uncharacterized protein n=1 Tax=Takifugu flavidus TaxID=433684 RepID=A0A5C6P6K6_9TELE|nr:hypothetical protein D4764_14G0004540 [Takifugu flavidus]